MSGLPWTLFIFVSLIVRELDELALSIAFMHYQISIKIFQFLYVIRRI